MPDEDSYTLEETETAFAKKLNGKVWRLLEMLSRSSQDDKLMIHGAHASCFHWWKSRFRCITRGLNG